MMEEEVVEVEEGEVEEYKEETLGQRLVICSSVTQAEQLIACIYIPTSSRSSRSARSLGPSPRRPVTHGKPNAEIKGFQGVKTTSGGQLKLR